MPRRFQFSIRLLLAIITILAVSLAAILQVPHVFVFAIGMAGVIFTSLTTYRQVKNARPRLHLLLALIVTWFAFYVLSLGPFIFLSEIERKLTGQYHVGRLATVYRPAMRLNHWGSFRWYVIQWIPPDAVGLHELNPTNLSPDLVGAWQMVGDTGRRLVNLRADGTGQEQYFNPPQTGIYFEWTSNANEFAIYQFGSKRSAFAWFGRVLMDYAPTDTFDVVECSATHFKLRDKSGITCTLTRAKDREPESFP
jgi:hypothetical protein